MAALAAQHRAGHRGRGFRGRVLGVAQREREARLRTEALSAEVAQLAAANERNRMAREIHDTLGHY